MGIGQPNVSMELTKTTTDLVMEVDGPNMTVVNIKIKSVITKKMSKKRNKKFQTLALLPKEKQSKKISEAIIRTSKRCRNFFLYTKMLFSIVQEANKILIATFMTTGMMKKMVKITIYLVMQEMLMLPKKDPEKLVLKLDHG